ncbi:phosphatase PAP2 family protein [Streptomyces longwoodensis]|uniref:phosphatase PAP2 family protein n=1 Tax=Streptomyces longwoodensis TaxID=68231 RepID=UPI00384C97BE
MVQQAAWKASGHVLDSRPRGRCAPCLAAMVALERVQSGAHHPNDVAAGALIGLASAGLIRRTPQLARHGWS